MTPEALTRWIKRTRRTWGLKGLALLFKVNPRTVNRWIDAGLPEHKLAGVRAAALYEDEDGSERWGFAPLAVLHWTVERVEDSKGKMKEPGLLEHLRHDFPRWYKFLHKQPDAPPAYADDYPGFSWAFCLEPSRWSYFAGWFWQVYFVEESDGGFSMTDCPLAPITGEAEDLVEEEAELANV